MRVAAREAEVDRGDAVMDKNLATEFQTRIEMRQIGVRDEAKLLADYGDCGKPVCCNTHLSEMPPVSMKMAKLQRATLDPSKGSNKQRRRRFHRLKRRLKGSGDAVRMQMAVVMVAFSAGLFTGPEVDQQIRDNLELERWFRLPKGHERRIHGRKHAGVRLVQQGATLMPALDAHTRERAVVMLTEALGEDEAHAAMARGRATDVADCDDLVSGACAAPG